MAGKCRLQHMSLQSGIASYVITKRHCIICHYKAASKCRLYHTSSNINKRNTSLNIKKTPRNMQLYFKAVESYILYPHMLLWNTQPIKTYMDWIKNKSFSCHFLLNFFPFRTSMWIHLQNFMCLLPFSFKLFPLCTSMWIHLHRFIFLLSFSFELFPCRTSMFF